MYYLIVSFSYKNTDIQTREKLAFNSEIEKRDFLDKVVASQYINEAILVSTCNRIEIIASVNNINLSAQDIINILHQKSSISEDELSNRADIYEDKGAIHHLFTVASSLDSLVIGETQIAGQLKDAFKFSLQNNYSDIKLSRALNYSFKCAAAVRTATNLGTGSVSVASTAVAKAKEIFTTTTKALVIGAGEMSELSIKHLLQNDFSVVLVSRNIKKASILASSFDSDKIEVYEYSKLNELLNSMELLFTATSSPYPIIKQDMVKDCDFTRHWFDIAVPRDIEDIDMENLHIYSVDDLKNIINKNIEIRNNRAKEAYSIVKRFTDEFYIWLKSLDVEPTIKSIYLNANKIIDKKVENAINKGFIPDSNVDNIKKLCQTVINEFLYQPSKNLRNTSNSLKSDDMVETIQYLCGIE